MLCGNNVFCLKKGNTNGVAFTMHIQTNSWGGMTLRAKALVRGERGFGAETKYLYKKKGTQKGVQIQPLIGVVWVT